MSGYQMRTTRMCETSNGIYWHADLTLDGRTVGHIEQDGHGGADKVTFQFIADREAWKNWVEDQFVGSEEDATFHLMAIEDAALVAEVTT
jgi:hypothetical protein